MRFEVRKKKHVVFNIFLGIWEKGNALQMKVARLAAVGGYCLVKRTYLKQIVT